MKINECQQILLILSLISALIGFNPHLNKKKEKPNIVEQIKLEHWECWIGEKYTRIEIVPGDVFKATLHTDAFGKLTLRGHKVTDTTGLTTQLIGSIEKHGEYLAVGTFIIDKVTAIGEKQPKYTLMGQMSLLAEKTPISILMSRLK